MPASRGARQTPTDPGPTAPPRGRAAGLARGASCTPPPGRPLPPQRLRGVGGRRRLHDTHASAATRPANRRPGPASATAAPTNGERATRTSASDWARGPAAGLCSREAAGGGAGAGPRRGAGPRGGASERADAGGRGLGASGRWWAGPRRGRGLSPGSPGSPGSPRLLRRVPLSPADPFFR